MKPPNHLESPPLPVDAKEEVHRLDALCQRLQEVSSSLVTVLASAKENPHGPMAGSVRDRIEHLSKETGRIAWEATRLKERVQQSGPRTLTPTVHPKTRAQPSPTPQKHLVYDEETMGTGVATIDRQHKELIQWINNLQNAVATDAGEASCRRILDFLGTYVTMHFRHEEEVMSKHRCAASGANKKAHQSLILKYTDWRQQFDQQGYSREIVEDLLAFLGDWIVSHMTRVDSQLRDVCEPCPKKKLVQKKD